MRMKKLLTLTIAVLGVAALSANAADGKALYEKNCAKCHGADGKGDTKMGKKLEVRDYTDAKVQASFTDDQAAAAPVCHTTEPPRSQWSRRETSTTTETSSSTRLSAIAASGSV